jgi:ankyrin repeat protein
MTALMIAAFNGHTNVCAALIIAGADISTTADLGYGPHRLGRALWSRWRKDAHGAGTLQRIMHVSAISRRSTPRLYARCPEGSMQLALS